MTVVVSSNGTYFVLSILNVWYFTGFAPSPTDGVAPAGAAEHLGILVFTEARLGAHHLGIYFVTKLAAGLRIVHA